MFEDTICLFGDASDRETRRKGKGVYRNDWSERMDELNILIDQVAAVYRRLHTTSFVSTIPNLRYVETPAKELSENTYYDLMTNVKSIVSCLDVN